MRAHRFTGSPARAGVVRVGVVERWVGVRKRVESSGDDTQGFSPGRRCAVPGALGLLTQVSKSTYTPEKKIGCKARRGMLRGRKRTRKVTCLAKKRDRKSTRLNSSH